MPQILDNICFVLISHSTFVCIEKVTNSLVTLCISISDNSFELSFHI